MSRSVVDRKYYVLRQSAKDMLETQFGYSNRETRQKLSQKVCNVTSNEYAPLYTMQWISTVLYCSTLHYTVSNLKRAIQHSNSSNERLFPKKLEHLLPHPICKLVLHPRQNCNYLPPSLPDVQRFYESTRRLPWNELIVRTREHEYPFPCKGSSGSCIICAYQSAQRRRDVRRGARYAGTQTLCALLYQRDEVGTTAYGDADADPRLFNWGVV